MLLSAPSTMVRRLVGAVFYCAAALATANWLDYGLWGPQPYAEQTLMRVAVVGSIMLALACLSALLHPSYNLTLALVGEALSWPYFGFLAISLPWSTVVWMWRVHVHGSDQLAAIFGLVAATAFSLWQTFIQLAKRRYGRKKSGTEGTDPIS